VPPRRSSFKLVSLTGVHTDPTGRRASGNLAYGQMTERIIVLDC